MALAWRIVKTKYASDAFTGKGARLFGGRWTSAGRSAIYTSGSIALATLEVLVHVDDTALLASYSLFPVEIPDNLITVLDPSLLPANWRTSPAPARLQSLGDDWIDEAIGPALKVPSAIVPAEFNYILNPGHSRFSGIVIGKPQKYEFDSRL